MRNKPSAQTYPELINGMDEKQLRIECHRLWYDLERGAFNSASESTGADATSTAEADLINHPPHYTAHPSGVECITITREMNFNLGNAMKYIWRCGLKASDSSIADLQKAAWYINDEIERLKKWGL